MASYGDIYVIDTFILILLLLRVTMVIAAQCYWSWPQQMLHAQLLYKELVLGHVRSTYREVQQAEGTVPEDIMVLNMSQWISYQCLFLLRKDNVALLIILLKYCPGHI